MWSWPFQAESWWHVLTVGAGCRTAGTDGPPGGPLRLLPHGCLARWRWLGLTQASSWRKLKASVGTRSPEEAAEQPQGCGWGGRERWLGPS